MPPKGRPPASPSSKKRSRARSVTHAQAGDLRTAILDAAVRVLEREGPSALKQTRVAKEAGVLQGHLTYYFPRKVDLFVGVFHHVLEQGRRAAFSAVADAVRESPSRGLFSMAKALVADPKRNRLLLGLLLESTAHPEMTRELEELLRMQRTVISVALQRDPGDIRVAIAVAALRGMGVEAMSFGKDPLGFTTEELVDELETLLRTPRTR